MDDLIYRRHQPRDRTESYRMFRASVFDYVRQIGLVGADDTDDVGASWGRQSEGESSTDRVLTQFTTLSY